MTYREAYERAAKQRKEARDALDVALRRARSAADTARTRWDRLADYPTEDDLRLATKASWNAANLASEVRGFVFDFERSSEWLSRVEAAEGTWPNFPKEDG